MLRSLISMMTAIGLASPGCDSGGGHDQEPAVEAGMLEAQAFSALRDGDVMWVREGIQTGKWIMPSIRAVGVAEEAELTAEVILDDGRAVGGIKLTVRFLESADGALLLDYFPIPIAPDGTDVGLEEIYGSAATLELHLVDASGTHAESSTAVRLENGDSVLSGE